MKFLAIDTSGGVLAVAAKNGNRETVRLADRPLRHSETLMGEIDAALSEVGLALSGCDFLACVVGPGSFTGLRIGIATVKGLCFGTGLPAAAVTSFDRLAYAVKEKNKVCAVDAGHGYYYAKGYGLCELAAGYYPAAQAEEAARKGIFVLADEKTDGAGLLEGAAHAELISADGLEALYLRRSSAEERT